MRPAPSSGVASAIRGHAASVTPADHTNWCVQSVRQVSMRRQQPDPLMGMRRINQNWPGRQLVIKIRPSARDKD
jgi:hypothetical protein